jgi:DNA (cytosine-5)-methyltransferase 1
MSKPRLLDLFCCAGGAGMGYHRAGFEVVGVDINPQPHYPFEFHQADALTYPLDGFDAYHASPPCQGYSDCTPMIAKSLHPRLIADIRERLQGKLYVIENVRGAKRELHNPLMLCGSMFGLRIHRHRYFEISKDWYPMLPHCYKPDNVIYITGSMKGKNGRPHALEPLIAERKQAMGIDWMVTDEIDEAIPPAYTEYIGKYLMQVVLESK